MANATPVNDNGLNWSEATVFNIFVKKKATEEERALSLGVISELSGLLPQHTSRALVKLKEKHGRQVTKTTDNRYFIEALHRDGLMKEDVPRKLRGESSARNGKAATTKKVRMAKKAKASTNGRRRRQPAAEKPAVPETPAPDPEEQIQEAAERFADRPGLDPTCKDPESTAIGICTTAILDLEEIAQVRVLDYLAHRFVSEERRAELRAAS